MIRHNHPRRRWKVQRKESMQKLCQVSKMKSAANLLEGTASRVDDEISVGSQGGGPEMMETSLLVYI